MLNDALVSVEMVYESLWHSERNGEINAYELLGVCRRV